MLDADGGLAELANAATEDTAVPDEARVDRLALYERARGALAAAQHTEMVAFAKSQVADQQTKTAEGKLDPRKLGRGIADQIGLACHVSPHTGSRRLGVARALASDLPATRGLLVAGRISEQVAEKVVFETSLSA